MGRIDADPKARGRVPLLERDDLKPEERARVGRAVASLLGWGLVASAALGLLALWHIVRRGRVLRASLGHPKSVSLPEADDLAREPSPHD